MSLGKKLELQPGDLIRFRDGFDYHYHSDNGWHQLLYLTPFDLVLLVDVDHEPDSQLVMLHLLIESVVFPVVVKVADLNVEIQ